MRNVQDIRDRHGYFEEFKFSKITRARIPVFCELVDALEQSDAHIAACIVDRNNGTDPFRRNEPQWIAHARITAQLLVGIINKRELASALVTAACVDSRSNDGVQLADLVAGAVAHQCGLQDQITKPSSHKGKIAGRLAAAFGVQALCDTRTERVNIATLGAAAPKRRLHSVAETISKVS